MGILRCCTSATSTGTGRFAAEADFCAAAAVSCPAEYTRQPTNAAIPTSTTRKTHIRQDDRPLWGSLLWSSDCFSSSVGMDSSTGTPRAELKLHRDGTSDALKKGARFS